MKRCELNKLLRGVFEVGSWSWRDGRSGSWVGELGFACEREMEKTENEEKDEALHFCSVVRLCQQRRAKRK